MAGRSDASGGGRILSGGPAVAGALIGFAATATVSIATQLLGLRREAAQLRHATRLQTDADARSVLDDALATAVKAHDLLERLELETARFARLPTDAPRSVVSKAADELTNPDDETRQLGGQIRLMSSRVTIRFGPGDALTAAYYKVEALHAEAHTLAIRVRTSVMARTAGDEYPSCHDPATLDRLDELHNSTGEAIDEFAEKAHAWSARD